MARFKKQLPSVETLHHWFTANYETGELFWKNPRGPRAKVGDKVYYQNSNYPRIELQDNYKKHSFLVHRVIWKMYYGKDLGQQELDHIDGDKWNNAISNLRIASPTQNQHNIKRKGFYWHKKDRKWRARGYHLGKQYELGSFDCPLLARLAYETFKKEVAGEFCPDTIS